MTNPYVVPLPQPHGAHCFHPDLEGVLLALDVTTGAILRLKTAARPGELKVRERCCKPGCKEVRMREWKMEADPAHNGLSFRYVLTTSPVESICPKVGG